MMISNANNKNHTLEHHDMGSVYSVLRQFSSMTKTERPTEGESSAVAAAPMVATAADKTAAAVLCCAVG